MTKYYYPQQWILAKWATKTAMVFEYVTHERRLYYTQAERGQLQNSLELLPSFTFVWLAQYSGRLPMLTFGTDGHGNNPNAPGVQAYTTTLAFGALAIQVVSVRPDPQNWSIPIPTIHPKSGPWQHTTVRVWPTKKAVAWPPQQPFMDKTFPTIFTEFHLRFDNPTMEDGGFSGDDVIRIE